MRQRIRNVKIKALRFNASPGTDRGGHVRVLAESEAETISRRNQEMMTSHRHYH